MKVNSKSVCKQGTVELITVVIPGVAVHYVYKTPTGLFELTHWDTIIPYGGYITTDDVGNAVNS